MSTSGAMQRVWRAANEGEGGRGSEDQRRRQRSGRPEVVWTEARKKRKAKKKDGLDWRGAGARWQVVVEGSGGI